LPSKQSYISLLCWLINLKRSKFKSLIDFLKFDQLRKKHKQEDFKNLNFINSILISHALKNVEFFTKISRKSNASDFIAWWFWQKQIWFLKAYLYCKIYDYDYSLLVSSAAVLYKHKNHHTRRNHTVSHN